MAKKKATVDTGIINLGPSTELPTQSTLNNSDLNFVLVHRHYEPLLQKWGNLCSRVVTRIVSRDAYEKPIHWYHIKLYNFCYAQYDKYGDYYRILDNSFGEADNDDIYEVR
jgi:hypothetical protein